VFRLVSLNLNGIRSAAAKGFEAWAEGVGADCMGVQEIKAQAEIVKGRFDTVAGMKGRFHFAEKKGYSGVGLYSRKRPSASASVTPSSTPKDAMSSAASTAPAGAACRA